MHPIFQRFSIRITRGWAVVVLLIAGVVGAAFWIGPLQPLPAQLQLVAVDPAGRFSAEISLTRADTDSAAVGDVRVPLLLAARNVGAQPATPVGLWLSVPAFFRLTRENGTELPHRAFAGSPLQRYALRLRPTPIPTEGLPILLGGIDTLWLEPVLPAYSCRIAPDGVPEFMPAPVYDPALLSRVRIFYSFVADSRARQAGLLTVDLDPALVRREPLPAPPVYPTSIQQPNAPLPAMGKLVSEGSRAVRCGDVARRVDLRTVVWRTAEGGRFIVVYADGAPRKYLFDLDADSTIEQEMWDADGNGRFEATRRAHYPIPGFLLPSRPRARNMPPAVIPPTDSVSSVEPRDTAAARRSPPAPAVR